MTRRDAGQGKGSRAHFSKFPHVIGELGLTLYLRERDWRVLEAMGRHTNFATGECRTLASILMGECEIAHRKQLERSQRKLVGLGIFRRAGILYWHRIPIRRFYQCSEREIVAHVEKGCREGWFPVRIRRLLEAWRYAQELRHQADQVAVDVPELVQVQAEEVVGEIAYKGAPLKRVDWKALNREMGW